MGNKVTMNDVAEKAGVSKSTVSYVLSGKKKLSESVRQKVLEAVKDLEYRPQQVAPELYSDSTNQIIFYTDNLDVSYDVAVMQHELIRGVIDQLSSSRYVLCFYTPKTQLSPTEMVEPIKGIISLTPEKTDTFKNTQYENLPIVYIGSPKIKNTYFSVDVDGIGAGYQAALNLPKASLGKTLFFKNTDWTSWYNQYEQGYKLAVEEYGLGLDGITSLQINDFDALFKALEKFKDTGVKSIVVPSDYYAALLVNDPNWKEVAVISMRQYKKNKAKKVKQHGTIFPAYELGVEASKMLQNIISRQRVVHNSVIITCDFQ